MLGPNHRNCHLFVCVSGVLGGGSVDVLCQVKGSPLPFPSQSLKVSYSEEVNNFVICSSPSLTIRPYMNFFLCINVVIQLIGIITLNYQRVSIKLDNDFSNWKLLNSVCGL